ncbi:MAG: tRNA pseudouridine(38-40) synthase TruA [Planctomycetota bacterium]|nr:MAG: tRNA pseudouridine(38-40) synthase TruA [Planctomycetota bacterium]
MSRPRRIALLLAYHGGAFHGFQRQPGFPTVQEELERAWAAVTGENVVVHGSGRTDAGVHAWGQVAHLNTWSRLPLEKVRPALNAYLPEEAAVRAAAEVDPSFHARASACGKRYLYRLAVGPVRPVLTAGLVGWERRRRPLDLAAMRAAAGHLRGRHDFAAFAAAGGAARTTVRELRRIHIRPVRGGLQFLFEGDGFLYRMVRNLVGTLLEVGRGVRAPEWAGAVLASRDRRRAGATAPAAGLCLWRVLYPVSPFAGLSPVLERPYPFPLAPPGPPAEFPSAPGPGRPPPPER